MKKIRTRFAPSPTGYMHIGNLRTALYAYLFAKSQGGDFILRIEDTDRARYVADAVEFIENTLAAAKIIPDEGPHHGGNFAPYVQSERMEIYKKYSSKADMLITKNLKKALPFVKKCPRPARQLFLTFFMEISPLQIPNSKTKFY